MFQRDPTPQSPEEVPAVVEQAPLTPEERITIWRLRQLVRAYSDRVVVLDEQDVAALEALAASKAEYQQVVKAFEVGCTLGQAMAIFL